MKYTVVKPFRIRTSEGVEMDVSAGMILDMLFFKAEELIRSGNVESRVAVRIYSELLKTYLWLVESERDIGAFENPSADPTSTFEEIKKLKSVDTPAELLKRIYEAKRVFPGSNVKEMKRRDG